MLLLRQRLVLPARPRLARATLMWGLGFFFARGNGRPRLVLRISGYRCRCGRKQGEIWASAIIARKVSFSKVWPLRERASLLGLAVFAIVARRPDSKPFERAETLAAATPDAHDAPKSENE